MATGPFFWTVLMLSVLAAPAGADGSPEDPEADSDHCQAADYSLSKPTSVVVDPDRCFIPYLIDQISP